MAITADVLRELHRIHKQLTDLRDRLDRGPKQVRAAVGNVARLEAELEQARASTQRARLQVDDRQLQLKEREARIADLQKKLNSAASNREYQAFKEQIAADLQANSVLEDEILEGMEKTDVLTAEVAAAEANAKKASEECEKVKKRIEMEVAPLKSERIRVEEELQRVEKELPADLRVEYKRLSEARGEEALAQVDGEVCGSCFQTLTTQMMNELYLAKPLSCKNCGALMYLAEGRKL